jgi:adenylate cyclase
MVTALERSERMERAFGVYVSGQVLELIRAQHGEAAIPAALRDASVFFADIRGFTSLSERLSPEAVVGFLNRYFARVVQVVDRHQGYLNKFIGDAVVVVFNGPMDQPDHATRAMRCALELQAEVRAMNEAKAFPELGELRVGVGIATGPMVCGNIGSPTQMEYTVIGDTVNLSARLTSHAGAAEVWASEATVAKLPEDLQATALEPIKVKGKEKPVTPFRVTRRS